MAKDRRGPVAKLLLALGAVGIALLGAEILLRLVGVGFPSFQQFDPDRGTALRPGARGWYREEGRAYIEINSQGLRDREHEKENSEGTLRIAVLGDSYAEARQVAIEDTFWSVTERKLAACPKLVGKKVEVINFGVSGYGTAQELITLRRRVWEYSPGVVVLAFVTGNDVRNNSRALDGEPLRPYFIPDGDLLVLDDSFRESRAYLARQSLAARALYRAIDHSRILQLANRAKNALRAENEVRRRGSGAARPGADAAGGELGLDDAIYFDPPGQSWHDAWRVTELLISEVNREVKAKGATFLLVTLSNGIQVHPDPKVRAEFVQRRGIADLFKPEERIRGFGDREDVAVLNLARPLQDYAEKNRVFLHGFTNTSPGSGHWNEEGHRLAGELISAKLCELLGE